MCDVRQSIGRCVGVLLAGFALTACGDDDAGYVEIRTVPPGAALQSTVFLGSAKLEPPKKGVAIVRQKVGSARLQTEVGGGQLNPLCDVVVRKNRITTVMVSDRPPRCQCKRSDRSATAAKRICIS